MFDICCSSVTLLRWQLHKSICCKYDLFLPNKNKICGLSSASLQNVKLDGQWTSPVCKCTCVERQLRSALHARCFTFWDVLTFWIDFQSSCALNHCCLPECLYRRFEPNKVIFLLNKKNKKDHLSPTSK